jgi:hypothetical protein
MNLLEIQYSTNIDYFLHMLYGMNKAIVDCIPAGE